MLASSENFMLEEIMTDKKIFKFGTTDLEFSLCMNKEYDDKGMEKGDCYIVESLRDEDCFNKSKNVYVVTHILAKDNTARMYTDVLFVDKSSSLQEIPDEILKITDNRLFEEK